MSNGVEANGNQEIHEHELEPMLPKPVENLLECIQGTKDNEKSSSIFEVPSRLRDVNTSSFTPRVVSIGPLHKGGANLKLMEAKKATYLDELLNKVEESSPKETLTKCYEKVMVSIEKIKRCYFGLVMDKAHYTNDELAQMMVMDACFILQFVYNLSKSGNLLSENRLRSRSIGLDLVLLENQIPFFVLQDIYDLTLNRLESIPTLNTMLLDLLERVNPFLEKLKDENLSDQKTPYHILGLLHQFYQPKGLGRPVIKTIPTAHTAVELYKVGVRFRPNENMKWPMAIEFEFSPKPTLKMPKVLIDNFFEVVMRNLIVYEQYTPGIRNYVTSFAMAMDMLAATPADVAKLAESNVLVSHLGSNEKVSKMINSICKDVTFLDFYYIESWKNAKDYYDSYWRKNFGLLKRKYFSTPWKAIALLAAIIIFSVSMVQFVIRIITFRSSH